METVKEIQLLEQLYPEDDILTIRQFGRAFGSVTGFRNPPVAQKWKDKLAQVVKTSSEEAVTLDCDELQDKQVE